MNRDVVVGSDLACADLSLELHTALLTGLPLISFVLMSLTAQSCGKTYHRCSKHFLAEWKTP